jgi:hypothetical protein
MVWRHVRAGCRGVAFAITGLARRWDVRKVKLGAVFPHYVAGYFAASEGMDKHPTLETNHFDRPSFLAGWQRWVRRNDHRRIMRRKRWQRRQEAFCASP